MNSLVSSFSLSTLILLSTIIGYFVPSDAEAMSRMSRANYHRTYPILNEDRDVTHSDLVEPALKHQQREDYWTELESLVRVNETLWATVVAAVLQQPFDWKKLSKALDTMEEDFQRLSPDTRRNFKESDEELKRASPLEKSSRGSRWKFTYHRVLTFLRNSSGPGKTRRLSAIAAVSASEIRPSPPPALHHPPSWMPSSPSSLITNPLLQFHSHSTTTEGATVQRETSGQETFTLEDEILSRLFQEQENNEGEDDYQIHGRDQVSSSSSKRHFHQSSRKLRDHSERIQKKKHPVPPSSHQHHHHQMNHDDNSFNHSPNGYSHHENDMTQ